MERRQVFALGAAGAAAAGAGFAVGAAVPSPAEAHEGNDAGKAVAFHGRHQAGITTPTQDRLHFAAFDVITDSRDELVDLLKKWTKAASRMCSGDYAGPGGAVSSNVDLPPDDTGEAQGLPASGLTVTIGFGPSLFRDRHGADRFGIAKHRPRLLEDLPGFAGDDLDESISHGDLCVQACANDPQVAVHAVRNLARIGFGRVSIRWSQLGFGRTASTSTHQATPRNLFGFKDGTHNLKSQDTDDVHKYLWVNPGDGPSWLTGGSYLVTRKIRMMVEPWDRTMLSEQEQVFGRDKSEGAPLSGTKEFDAPDFNAKDAYDQLKIPKTAHVRLAHPSRHNGVRMLRRGYSYVDGSDRLGRLDCGLFFIAYQRDPEKAFISVQKSLSTSDGLNEYIRHTSSGIFACPPGVADDGKDYWGRSLFGQ